MTTGLSANALAWLGAVLSERFGVALTFARDPAGHVALRSAAGPERFLFPVEDAGLTTPGGDPPFAWWDAATAGVEPLLGLPLPLVGEHGDPARLVERTDTGDVLVHCDLPGILFWALARVEEVGRTDLDRYGRFPALASHAGRHGYLDRPFVDEWLDLLGQLMRRTWTRLKLRAPAFRLALSHDVDLPSRYAMRPLRGFIGAVAEDLRGGHVRRAARGALTRLRGGRSLRPHDPANTFDWLMGRAEGAGTRAAFYFICGRTVARMDAGYDIEQPAMRTLLRRIHARGHEVGLHPSFGSQRDAAAIAREADRLRATCTAEGIIQPEWGGRMHYLRWTVPDTLLAWEGAAMDYDGTMGYADRAGFRCGTCHEYQAFDPVGDRAVRLRIRPLVAMEVSVMSSAYMALGTGERALAAFATLKQRCRRARGTFSLLWHNSELVEPAQRGLFDAVLAE